MSEEKSKDGLSINSYVSISLIGTICLVVVFVMDIKTTTKTNKANIESLKGKVSRSFNTLEKDLDSIKKEQQFLRETMIRGINEVRKMVYRIDGKLESFDKIYDNKRRPRE